MTHAVRFGSYVIEPVTRKLSGREIEDFTVRHAKTKELLLTPGGYPRLFVDVSTAKNAITRLPRPKRKKRA